MTITIYTKPGCPPCTATKRKIVTLGLDFLEIDITARPDIIDQLKAEGHAEMPVVKTGHETWTGYRPDKLAALA